MKTYSSLRDEILEKRGKIYTSQLNMSVGELMSLYADEEINLEPSFQRLFRWTEQQQTNFVESILLGYPIPSIFVLQKKSGVWDVIDGVQRLSTIYHFVGILRNPETKNTVAPLKLHKVKILTHLKDKYYSSESGESLDIPSKIDFKRAIIPVIILKENSYENSKFELFRRLNTGGTHLSAQEIRNALILMSSKNVYNKMDLYCKNEYYRNFLNLSENQNSYRQDMDILTRFIVMRNYKDLDNIDNSIDINEFLDDAICDIVTQKEYDINTDLSAFDKIIKFLSENINEQYGFQVFDKKKQTFKGGFNWVIFETIVWGLSVINDISILEEHKTDVIDKIESLKGTGELLKSNCKSNVRVIVRLKMAKDEAKVVFNFE